MGRLKRIVNVDFWTDKKVGEEFTPEDKLFMLYLLTNPQTTQLGIYPITVRIMAFELGYSPDTVRYLLNRFENVYGVIRWSKDTDEIAVKNFLRHSIISGGKPVEDLLKKEAAAVINQELIVWVCKHLQKDIESGRKINDTVKKIVPFLLDTYNPNDNHYENENDKSYPKSSHDSSDDSSHDSSDDSSHDSSDDSPHTHKAYGRYKNVMLSDEDMDELKAEFPNDWRRLIEEVSEYVASTGKPYSNYLAALRRWARNGVNNGGNNRKENPALKYEQRGTGETDYGNRVVNLEEYFEEPM